MPPPLVAKFSGRILRSARAERRISRRLSPMQATPCQLTTADGIPVENALIRDLSAHGAGILSEQSFAPGSVVHLLLVNASHTFAISVEYHVIRCTRNRAGTYFLGGRFSQQLDHETLVPFLV